MTDRERILTVLTNTMLFHKDELPRFLFGGNKKEYTKGNILIATTNFSHKFSVSIFDHYDEELGCVVVKDLVSDKLCNYYNESFVEIPRDWVGEYTLLTGKKRKIFEACKFKLHSVEFDDAKKTVTVRNRLAFHDEPNEKITISTELPLKEIKKQLYFGKWKKVANNEFEVKQ